jgi:hypothetical protein
LSYREKINYVIFWKTDETGDPYVEQNKPDLERQMTLFS